MHIEKINDHGVRTVAHPLICVRVCVCVCAILLIPIKPIGPICPRYLHAVRQFKFSFKTLVGGAISVHTNAEKYSCFLLCCRCFYPINEKHSTVSHT